MDGIDFTILMIVLLQGVRLTVTFLNSRQKKDPLSGNINADDEAEKNKIYWQKELNHAQTAQQLNHAFKKALAAHKVTNKPE